MGQTETTDVAVTSVADLKDGCYYIWHNENETDIYKDLNGTVESEVFKLCPTGDINWKKDNFISHTIWFTSDTDIDIPTLYPGDKLLYISSTSVPYEGIQWEHFGDFGYTIGVANMVGDNSGHYRIICTSEENGYVGYVYDKSDAGILNKYTGVSELFLDKVGSVDVRNNMVSSAGTISGLEKNERYVCEWYTGTYYQDYIMQANIRTFCTIETFTTYEYEFLHSRCIEITIPSYLKTGYYYLDEIGLFRYVASSEAGRYNGLSYDANINWNEPIIIRNEKGEVIYDPTNISYLEDTTYSDYDVESYESEYMDSITYDYYEQDVSYTQEPYDYDVGAEGYETIENEIIVP